MATLADTRLTVLQTINEVRQKLGVKDAASLTADANTTVLLKYLNDVIDYISNYADWREMRKEVTVTASSSVYEYLVESSAVVKNVKEISFYGQIAPLRYVEEEEMRRWRRTNTAGVPRYWTLTTVDNTSTGNPYFQCYPQPGSTENNQTFSILMYEKPRAYTSSDASVVIPFPSRIVVSMLLALALLDESRGTNNFDYATELSRFNETLSQGQNRFNGDSGGSQTQFRPQRGGFRRV